MRIIGSKFHDYYDGVMAHGMDKELTYFREQKVRPIDARDKFDRVFVDYWHRFPDFGNEHTTEPGVVIFCGKQFPFFRLVYDRDRAVGYGTNINRHIQKMYAYTLNDVDEYIGRFGTKYTLDRYHGTNKTGKNRHYKRGRKLEPERDKFEAFLISVPFTDIEINEFHHAEKVPSILIEKNGDKGLELAMDIGFNTAHLVTTNPCLADIEFYKAVDAFTAFQEISMFLGGVIGTNAPKMVAVSDEVRAHKHGMDKTSFRMPPPGDRKFRRRGGGSGI